MAFKPNKGYLGVNIRWFLQLTTEQLEHIAGLLNAMEATGMWPEVVRHTLVNLLLKPTGDRRPIGLVDGLLKLWEGARKPWVQAWRSRMNRRYDSSSRGKRITDALWRQSLANEAAVATGQSASTALLDLVKAYEQLDLTQAWVNGLAMGFPLVILRMALEAFTFARHLTFLGLTAEAGCPSLTALLAGTTFALDILFLVVAPTCDALEHSWPTLRINLVVDDLALQVTGETSEVATTILHVVDDAMDRLTALGSEVSKGQPWQPGGKTTITTSDDTLQQSLQLGAKRRGLTVTDSARNLGHDYASGRATVDHRQVTEDRLTKMGHRSQRMQKQGWGHLARCRVVYTGLKSVGQFATESYGLSDGECALIDKTGHQAMGAATGRSAYARLTCARGLLSEDAALKPIGSWCRALFNENDNTDREWMLVAWRAAQIDVGRAETPWDHVRGPAGGIIHALRRIGWSMPTFDALMDRAGHVYRCS